MAVKKSTTIPAPPKAPVVLSEKPANVDDVPVLLTVLEDIESISESLGNVISLFRETGLPALCEAASVLDPISEKLALIVDNDFPDLGWIRKDLVERGLESKILGG